MSKTVQVADNSLTLNVESLYVLKKSCTDRVEEQVEREVSSREMFLDILLSMFLWAPDLS